MGYRIKEVREQKGITQQELAEKSGIARATIWKLETGSSEVTTTKTLVALAKALGVSVEDIFFTDCV